MSKIKKAIDALDGCDEYSLRHHMSEVSILIEGYAEAQTELAALREELANAESDNDTIAEHNIQLQQRLTAAEQRNAELFELVCGLPDEFKKVSFRECRDGADACIDIINEHIAALAQPTESGASE